MGVVEGAGVGVCLTVWLTCRRDRQDDKAQKLLCGQSAAEGPARRVSFSELLGGLQSCAGLLRRLEDKGVALFV